MAEGNGSSVLLSFVLAAAASVGVYWFFAKDKACGDSVFGGSATEYECYLKSILLGCKWDGTACVSASTNPPPSGLTVTYGYMIKTTDACGLTPLPPETAQFIYGQNTPQSFIYLDGPDMYDACWGARIIHENGTEVFSTYGGKIYDHITSRLFCVDPGPDINWLTEGAGIYYFEFYWKPAPSPCPTDRSGYTLLKSIRFEMMFP